MKLTPGLKAIACVAMFAASQFVASNAAASLIDFEEVADWTELTPSGMSASGYKLAMGDGGNAGAFSFIIAGTGDSTGLSGNGSTRLVNFNGANVTLSAANQGAFDLFSFDGGESWFGDEHFWADRISVVGTLAGGGTVTQTFDLDLVKHAVSGMQTFTLDASFRKLLSVTFSGIGGNPEFSIDNISVNAVPEPASGALLLLGAAGIAAVRRRRAMPRA
ncbi:PEP-CTERM sorting domain-containing protein [Massilia sp. UBA6681]|uniref:PEP-CTERM sorting domain-containing protein n=1 Tax=Massilia sp. UBA6681 TaxID=1946839 RepID=UPI0025BA3500|nr:PEP-CTERM sorting domain-containing protein [Massilia sp. UBA6681]